MKNYSKAIAAVISNMAILFGAINLPMPDLSPEMVAGIATVINGILVWAVPNK